MYHEFRFGPVKRDQFHEFLPFSAEKCPKNVAFFLVYLLEWHKEMVNFRFRYKFSNHSHASSETKENYCSLNFPAKIRVLCTAL